MDWGTWLKSTLDGSADVTDDVPTEFIFGAGAIEKVPAHFPFIEIKVGSANRGPFPGAVERVSTIWVHDEPGDYSLIDAVIENVKTALSGVQREAGTGEESGVCCRWIGDSQELADDGYHTITRNTSFQLNGKDWDA